MPRTARIDFPGARHHVMNRGARGENVFLNESYCSHFLYLLSQAVARYGIRIHGFAIMPNHFHLMVESVQGNLGDAMKYVTSQYGYYLNRSMGWDGQVFRGRYKNKLVHLDHHWIYLLAYLHLNPVRARLVQEPQDAMWTSHREYLGKRRTLDWLTTEELSDHFDVSDGYQGFISEVRNKCCTVPNGFESVTFESRHSSRMMVEKQKSLGPRIGVERALAEVQGVARCGRKDLLATRRGRGGNPARALAVWWLIHGAGLSNLESGKALNLSPNAVSKILRKLRTNPDAYGNGVIHDWMKKLKGQ